jgi:hypothetical protein
MLNSQSLLKPILVAGICISTVLSLSEHANGDEGIENSGEVITFLSHRTGDNLLYKMRPNGTDIKAFYGGEIRNMPANSSDVKMMLQPHWTLLSPNRKFFASWVYEVGAPLEKWKGFSRPFLIVGTLDGNWTRVVNADCHEEFAWSSDSKKLAFSHFYPGNDQEHKLQSSLRSSQIITCGIDGSNEEVVLEQPGILAVLDWSPDGKRLLLSRRYGDSKPNRSADLFELELASKKCRPYILEGSQDTDVVGARYSPDGKKIAIFYIDSNKGYAANEVAKDEIGKARMMRLLAKLALIDRDGKNRRVVADFPDGMRGPFCWSPKGDQLLVVRYLPKEDQREKFEAEHGTSIWRVPIDGSSPSFVTTGWGPDWH